ncbi:glycosyltransferase family 4 protein [Chloroflexota bacterium]
MNANKVLISCENYYPVGGGIMQYVRGLARELTKRGYRIIILTQYYDEPKVVEMEEGTIHYSPLMTGSMREPFKVMKRYKEFSEFIKDNEVGLVYANNHNSLALIEAAKYSDTPIVYGCGGVGLMCPRRIRFLKPDDSICYNEFGYWACLWCYRASLKEMPFQGEIRGLLSCPSLLQTVNKYKGAQRILDSADARIGNSKLCASLFRKREMTFGIPLAIDADEYKPVDSTEFMARFNIDGDYILVPGRLNHIKGQEYAIRALEFLDKDIKLVIAGNASMFQGDPSELGLYGARIKELIELGDLRNRIIFTGFLNREAMLQAYSGARVTIIPSVWLETFGYVTVESLGCATPVVVTENCGSAECVDNSCGRIIERKNPEAIANAVKEIWSKSNEMGIAGRDKVIREVNWQITADRTLEIFNKVLANHKGR